MKRKLLSVFLIGLFTIMLFPFSVNAKAINTLSVSEKNGKLTISGTTVDDVLAVAAVVYSNDTLIHMETCAVASNEYSCELSKIFAKGTYTVKVADYDGGTYVTKKITITKSASPSNPKTFDSIYQYVTLGIMSLLGLCGTKLYKKKRFN